MTIIAMHLLLIEDDPTSTARCNAAFRQEGFSCEWLRRGSRTPPVALAEWAQIACC